MAEHTIPISELPPRPRHLAAHELTGVFGGCATKGQARGADKDCCNNDCSTPVGGGADCIDLTCSS
jgi:hypothetical protein